MKRLTTEKPKDNVENTLNLFYIKDKETWIRGGGTAPEYKDVTLDNFMRRQIKERLPIDAPEDWREFSGMMAEWLFDDPESETGLLALLYAAAWGFAEIRDRLKRYEDTGAMPDVLEDLLKHLDRIESLGGWDLVDRWVKAASEGRLVEFPCAVGETAYWVHDRKITECKVHRVQKNREGAFLCLKSKRAHGVFRTDLCLGKTVFLNEKEAVAALATDKNDGYKQVNDLYDEDGRDIYE